jgi:hypothetical protein
MYVYYAPITVTRRSLFLEDTVLGKPRDSSTVVISPRNDVIFRQIQPTSDFLLQLLSCETSSASVHTSARGEDNKRLSC